MESTDMGSGVTAGSERSKGRRKNRLFPLRSDSDAVGAEGDSEAMAHEGDGASATGKGKFFLVNATEFVMALGLGLLFALLRIELSANLLFVGSLSVDHIAYEVAEIIGLLAFCATIIICWYYADYFERSNRGRVCLLSSAALAILSLTQGASQIIGLSGWVLPVLTEGLCGIPYAVMLIMWVAELWGLQRRAAARVLLISLCVSGVVVALISIISTSPLRLTAMAVCVLLSGFSYLAASPHFDHHDFVSREDTRKNLKFDMRTSASLFVAAVADGFAMGLTINFGENGFAVIVLAFFIAAVIVGVGIVFFGERGVLLSTISRWTFPALTIEFIFIPFVDGCILAICVTFVLAVCFACVISLFITLVQVKYRFVAQPVYACSRVIMPWALGVFAGLLLGLFGGWLSSIVEGTALTMLSMLIIVLFSISTAVAPYGIDMLTMPIEPESEDGQDEAESYEVHAWKTACEHLAKEGGLTPREKDVFMLLAKGRNAKVIERELFISVYTIKGHNNNIYRKLGVKSQQELIDLVESYRREIWKPKVDIEQGGEHE